MRRNSLAEFVARSRNDRPPAETCVLLWSLLPARSTVKSAQDSFLSVGRSLAPDAGHDADSLLPYWMAAVGRDLGRRSRPVRFVQGRLTVEVDGAEWREELIHLFGLIVSRLNKLLGGEPVKNISYRLTPLRREPGRAGTALGGADGADEASDIKDPQLRRLYRVSMKRAR